MAESTSSVAEIVNTLNAHWINFDQQQVLDREGCLEVVGGDWNFAVEMFSGMLDQLNTTIPAIHNTIASFASSLQAGGGSQVLTTWNDPATQYARHLMHHAHGIKGAARNLRLPRIVAASSNLEHIARALQSLSDCAKRDPNLAIATESVARQLTSKLQGLVAQLRTTKEELAALHAKEAAALNPTATDQEEEEVEYVYEETEE